MRKIIIWFLHWHDTNLLKDSSNYQKNLEASENIENLNVVLKTNRVLELRNNEINTNGMS